MKCNHKYIASNINIIASAIKRQRLDLKVKTQQCVVRR